MNNRIQFISQFAAYFFYFFFKAPKHTHTPANTHTHRTSTQHTHKKHLVVKFGFEKLTMFSSEALARVYKHVV